MSSLAPAGTSAAGASRFAAAKRSKLRSFITPEGTDLQLEIASAGLRFGALVLDLVLMLIILIVASIILAYTAFAQQNDGGAGIALIVWMLGFFLLRNFWFVGFELGPRAATPGKRAVGIRVVARDGGQLTVASVVARNLVREVELFLPFMMLIGAAMEDMVNVGLMVAGLVWALAMSMFLLFNRDRMRLGDLVGGTWVVVARRNKMALDLADGASHPGEPAFTAAELSVYGVFELQELEKVLRRGDAKAMMVVADTIRAKIGRPIIEDDRLFLLAYYRQARARMERDLLFGKRRENKYEAPV